MLSKSEIKRLNALKIKKYRVSEGLFVAEGPKILMDFIQSGQIPESLYFTSSHAHHFDDVPDEKKSLVTEEELKKISSLMHPQGCLGVFPIPEEKPVGKQKWLLALDNIQDPGNMGTLIRIADWFGIKDILCSEDTVDCYNPKVVQASMGSLARMRLHYLDLNKWLPENDRPVFAGILDGEDIRKVDFPERGVLLIGNEGNGIRNDLLTHVHHGITIPRLGKAESLNAGVAAGIMAAFALLSH